MHSKRQLSADLITVILNDKILEPVFKIRFFRIIGNFWVEIFWLQKQRYFSCFSAKLHDF